jgi:hypothetical protein
MVAEYRTRTSRGLYSNPIISDYTSSLSVIPSDFSVPFLSREAPESCAP